MPAPPSPDAPRRPEPTPALDRGLAAVATRARVQRGLVAAAPLAIGLGAGLVAVFLARDLRAISDREASAAALASIAITITLVIAAALRPLDPLRLAVALDRALGLRGRLGNALALRGDPSPMAALARRDAELRAKEIDPARVLPLRGSRSLAAGGALLVVAAVLFAIGPFAQAGTRRASTDEAPRLAVVEAPAAIDADALEALRERMSETRREQELTPEAQASTDALNALIEDLATGELTEEEALARIADLEASLDRGALARSAEIQRELGEAAQQMRARDSTEGLARALTEARLDDAAREMSELAERTRTEAPSREVLEDLRAMAEDRERRARERELEQAEEEEERLLERRREREQRGEEQPEEEERLLEQRQRELDRLRREHEARSEVERQLDELRRELGEAADRMEQEHRRPSEGASESMERAAEQLRQHARDQQSAEQMQELARELQRLREALREAQQQGQGQGGQGGQQEGQDGQEGGQGARMRRFTLRASGGQEEGGVSLGIRRPGGQGGEGGEQEGQGGQGGQQQGQGQPGEGGEQPGGQGGQGQGEQGEMLVLGEGGGAVLEIPGMGQGGGDGPPESGGGGEGEGGPGQGSSHDPTSLDDPSARLAGGRSVQVSGQPGEGPSRSQVIRGASSRGFASRDYERVFEDYASHADEAVERDRVPPGRRSYVQRYFELIRPRTTTESATGAGNP